MASEAVGAGKAGGVTAAGFTYRDPLYVAAATVLRAQRAAYFAACRTSPWDEVAVRVSCGAYADALAAVRAEEDRILQKRAGFAPRVGV